MGTIHLNPAAAGKGGRRNETREKRIGEEKGTERERERERRGRPGREKSQGEAVKVKRANTERVGGGVFVGRLYVVICVAKVHAQGQFGWAESSRGHNLALCTLTR